MILYVHGDGIKATNFAHLEAHIKSGHSLEKISVPQIQNVIEFENSGHFFIYNVNIFEMKPLRPIEYLELLRSNLKDISNFEEGDIIAFSRSFVKGLSYTHAAIFSGICNITNFKVFLVLTQD